MNSEIGSPAAIEGWRPGRPLPGRTILHLYFTNMRTSPSRAMRSGRTALAFGFADAILYVAHEYPGSQEFETFIPGGLLWNMRMPRYDGPLARVVRVFKLPLWRRRVLAALRNCKFEMIHCHSLGALPTAVALKRVTGAPILYNAHELESERTNWPWLVRKIAKVAEARLLRHVSHMLVVSDSIADWYRRNYPGLKVTTVRNTPIRPKVPPVRNEGLRRKFGIAPSDLVFIYVGAITYGRSIERMLEAFEGVRSDRHLVFLGTGPLESIVREAAQRRPNIHLHDPVSQEELLSVVAGADVSIVLMDPIALNYEYALPNKLFESLVAGLPVIGSPLVDIRRVLEETGRGWVLSSIEATALTELVNRLTPAEVQEKASHPAEIPTWDTEQMRLVSAMRDVLGQPA